MLKAARPDLRFPGAAFYPEDETRVRWLRPEEELLVLEPMPSPFREMAKLAALTLRRLSEIRTLRREAVHLEQGVVMLPRAKAGARPVILSGEAQKILRGQLAALERAQEAAQRKAEDEGRAAPVGERLRVPWARRAAVQPRPHQPGLSKGGPRGRVARLPLPRPPPPRRDDGAQQGIHGADRPGPRRMEDRADDATVRRGHR
jgi:integrase